MGLGGGLFRGRFGLMAGGNGRRGSGCRVAGGSAKVGGDGVGSVRVGRGGVVAFHLGDVGRRVRPAQVVAAVDLGRDDRRSGKASGQCGVG